ncbi:MAG: HD domain-containing protein [Deltaproteobacteria bacterium]|nr:HD domain-containing protein [Deltaproteobacteria bacterium]
MNKGIIIKRVAEMVKKDLKNEGSGHDWWHVYRVWKMAKRIAKEESADTFIIELAALLHDIGDWKFHDGDETVGPEMARRILSKQGVSEEIIRHVCEIISTMPFKGAHVKAKMRTLEGKVVQDADRLDAIGAIGIARAFAYGGSKNRPIYNPNQKPVMHRRKEEYLNSKGSSINHFYEKLLLLKDRMNTKTAKEIADQRHTFMEAYLDRFFEEWEGRI